MSEKRHPLEGLYFHSVDGDGATQWQGRILHALEDWHYLIELYEWVSGSFSHMVVVPSHMLETFKLYQTRDGLNKAYCGRTEPVRLCPECALRF